MSLRIVKIKLDEICLYASRSSEISHMSPPIDAVGFSSETPFIFVVVTVSEATEKRQCVSVHRSYYHSRMKINRGAVGSVINRFTCTASFIDF
jgi:hypothetical protein